MEQYEKNIIFIGMSVAINIGIVLIFGDIPMYETKIFINLKPR